MMSNSTFGSSTPELEAAAGLHRHVDRLTGGEDGHDDAIDAATDLWASKMAKSKSEVRIGGEGRPVRDK